MSGPSGAWLSSSAPATAHVNIGTANRSPNNAVNTGSNSTPPPNPATADNTASANAAAEATTSSITRQSLPATTTAAPPDPGHRPASSGWYHDTYASTSTYAEAPKGTASGAMAYRTSSTP